MLRRGLRTVAIVLAVAITVQAGSWAFWGKRQLARDLPELMRECQRQSLQQMAGAGHRLSTLPKPEAWMAVIADETEVFLGEFRDDFVAMIEGAEGTVLSEAEARDRGLLDENRCMGCAVVELSLLRSTPVISRVEYSHWSGGLAAAGWQFDLLWLPGRWVTMDCSAGGWVS